MPPEHGSKIGGVLRQSALRSFDQCPLRASEEARRDFTDYSSGPASLGTAFHLVWEEMLRTLNLQGEQAMPTEEAINVMREVIGRPECPHLSLEQQRELVILTLQAAQKSWPADRLLAIEERMTASVPCPDGVERRITGKPDAVFADPPYGAVCADAKVSWAVPATPRDGDFSREGGRPYLSERGMFQLDTNGLLIMRTLPSVQYVILREYYPRLNEFREARLDRSELEHVEQRLGVIVMRFEMVLAGELEPEPRPGKWCSHCPISRECPVPTGERAEGAIGSTEQADEEAARFQVVSELNADLTGALKNFYDETGYVPEVGDGRVVGWKQAGKSRRFGVWPREAVIQDENEAT